MVVARVPSRCKQEVSVRGKIGEGFVRGEAAPEIGAQSRAAGRFTHDGESLVDPDGGPRRGRRLGRERQRHGVPTDGARGADVLAAARAEAGAQAVDDAAFQNEDTEDDDSLKRIRSVEDVGENLLVYLFLVLGRDQFDCPSDAHNDEKLGAHG